MKHDLLNGIFLVLAMNLLQGSSTTLSLRIMHLGSFDIYVKSFMSMQLITWWVNLDALVCFQAVNSFLTGYRSHPLRVDVVDQQIHLVRIDFSRKKWQFLLLLKGLSLHYQNYPSHWTSILTTCAQGLLQCKLHIPKMSPHAEQCHSLACMSKSQHLAFTILWSTSHQTTSWS